MSSEDTLRRFGRVASDWQDQELVSGYRQSQDITDLLDETLTGTDGDDQLTGGGGDDIIEGGDGNDVLIGGAGLDVINGGAGDDYIADGWGTGTMDGGAGVDTVDVSHTDTGAVIDLVAGTIDWEGHSPTETATNFENVIGSNGNNTIIGTDGDNILDGQAGDDRFIGGGGNDTLYGGTGRSTYVYNLGDGSDVIYNGAGSSTETSDDSFNEDSDWDGSRVGSDGAAGKDHGQDSIVFGEGITAADVTISHVGTDLILTLTDGETLTLKEFDTYPVETLEFADGSTQDIASYQPQDWTGRRKTWFTSGRDNYFGGDGDDTLNGRSGHDQLHGGGGNDALLGGSGNDGLFGGAGDDRIDGGSGEDTIFGDVGDDWISGGYGVDYMDGGAGNDTLDYAYSIENVDIDLAAGESTFGSGETEITTNFENAVGSQGDNVITGTSGANIIDGGAGDDVIKGGAGDDRLKGGSGADIFEFSKGDGIDIIDDFDPATDTLRISGAGNDSIIIEYLTIGTLITYGRDVDGNPVDQVFLVGVASGLVTNDDIEKPDVEFIGTNEVDVFDGTDADEVISTHDGDDVINAGGGNDFIQAGDGADEVHAGAGNDVVEGGIGADTIWLDTGNDTFVDDAESGPTGNDEVHGGAGDDRFYGAGGDDVFYGDEGSDTLDGGAGNDTLVGDDGTANGRLFASYYRLTSGVTSVNDIPAGPADGVSLVDDLNVGTLATDLGGDDSYYGVRYVGVIEITTAGAYTFETGSDDGSELWIAGAKVVSNDGLHPMEYQSGSIVLPVGTYQFELNFFERTGENLLEVTVQGPDTAGAVLDLFDSGLLGDAGQSDNAPSGFGLEDVLNGGAGDDILTGGSGADLIELDFGDGIDVMTDFEDGLDIIDLGATGLAFGDLTITDAADGVHIAYETDAGGAVIGELILTDVTAAALAEEDFHFG